jgi:hypothetical protein
VTASADLSQFKFIESGSGQRLMRNGPVLHRKYGRGFLRTIVQDSDTMAGSPIKARVDFDRFGPKTVGLGSIFPLQSSAPPHDDEWPAPVGNGTSD